MESQHLVAADHGFRYGHHDFLHRPVAAQPYNGWLWGVRPGCPVPTAASPDLGCNVGGGGAGRVVKFGKLPANFMVGANYTNGPYE